MDRVGEGKDEKTNVTVAGHSGEDYLPAPLQRCRFKDARLSIGHLTVEAETPLPITETGYRSIFIPNSEVQGAGGVVAYVHSILNEAAKSKEWLEYMKGKNQLSLF